MTKPSRLEFHGALYHITLQVVRREDIFESDADRSGILNRLAQVCKFCIQK